VAQLERQAGLEELSRSVGDVIDRSQRVVDWEDAQSQNKILQARLESLQTQENAVYGNRNRLEEQKVMYAAAEVPLYLLNAIEGVKTELARIEMDKSEVKSKLASLAGAADVRTS
jgi:hypothetical protein